MAKGESKKAVAKDQKWLNKSIGVEPNMSGGVG